MTPSLLSMATWPVIWQHVGVTMVIACALAWAWRRWRFALPSATAQTDVSYQNGQNSMGQVAWPRLVLITLTSALLSGLPIANLTLTAWLTPFLGQLSFLSILLLMGLLWRLAQAPSGAVRPMLPPWAWGWIALLGVMLLVDLLALWPWDLYASGYLSQHSWLSGLRQSLPLLWWVGLLLLARPSIWLVLPWVIIAAGIAPTPNVWDAWTDLPLTLTAIVIVAKHCLAWRKNRGLASNHNDAPSGPATAP